MTDIDEAHFRLEIVKIVTSTASSIPGHITIGDVLSDCAEIAQFIFNESNIQDKEPDQ